MMIKYRGLMLLFLLVISTSGSSSTVEQFYPRDTFSLSVIDQWSFNVSPPVMVWLFLTVILGFLGICKYRALNKHDNI